MLVALGGCSATTSSSLPSFFDGRTACAGDLCAPEPEPGVEPDAVRAGLILFGYWKAEAEKVRPYIRRISNRSNLFGPDIARLEWLFAGMDRTREEGVAHLRRRDFHGAWGRLNGLWLQLPVLTLQLNYLIVASHGEDAGIVSTHWMDMLSDLSRRTTPMLDALDGWDPERIARAASDHRPELARLQAALPQVENAIRRGTLWTENALLVANGLTMAISAYELVGAIGTLPRGPGIAVRFPGMVGAGGAVASGGVVVISAEVLESLRELIRIGAISSSVLGANLVLMTGKPELVAGGPGGTATVSITPRRTWPSRPPDKNAQPRGRPERPAANDTSEKIRGLKRQEEAAQKLAEYGFDVERLSPRASKTPGTPNPDFKIEGRIFDHYAPASSRARNIWSSIRDEKIRPGAKPPQANRIVLNLADSEASLPELQRQFAEHPVPDLEEVILLTREGEIIHFYP